MIFQKTTVHPVVCDGSTFLLNFRTLNPIAPGTPADPVRPVLCL